MIKYIYLLLRGGVYLLFQTFVELILAPLIVGILVELFNYWLNH
ncbi:type I toxin-antitoxin system Fst family toxin [Selenomonas sp. AE3005]